MEKTEPKKYVLPKFIVAIFIAILILAIVDQPGSNLRNTTERALVFFNIQSYANLYLEQKRVMPDKFSDFITLIKLKEQNETLSFNELKENRTIKSVENLNTDKMSIIFSDNTKVTYYLSGVDVTSKQIIEKTPFKTILNKILILLLLASTIYLFLCNKYWEYISCVLICLAVLSLII